MALQHPQNKVVTLELLGDFPSLSYCPAMRVLIQVNPDGGNRQRVGYSPPLLSFTG